MTTLNIETPRWALPLLEPNLSYIGAYGGRGSGKSYFFASLVIERCISKKTFVLCVREVQKSLAQSVKKLITDLIEHYGLTKQFHPIQRDKITHPNGSIIMFHGLQDHTAETIKSFEGIDVAWIEEAQTISHRSLEILRPTIRKPGSQIWVSWNPKHPSDAIEFLRNDEFPNSKIVEVNFGDNPWFTGRLREEMEYDRKRNPDRFNHIWMGQFEKHSDAQVFHNWSVETFEAPMGTRFHFGADWGFSEDPTTLVRCYADGKKLYIDYEAYEKGCEIDNIPLLFSKIPDSTLYPIIADSARPDLISYMRKNGYQNIYPSVKGNNSLQAGIDWLLTYKIIVHPRCPHLVEELEKYSHKLDKNDDRIVTSEIEDKHNNVIDALRYACESLRRIDNNKPKIQEAIPQRNYW